MKKIIIPILILLSLYFPQSVLCEPIDELTDQFAKEYEALKPPSETSSVRTDYKFEQTALATFYTIKVLELMYDQIQQIVSKYDEVVQRYDKIIQQNDEIIKILTKIEKRQIIGQPQND